jgi:hypothetical protein
MSSLENLRSAARWFQDRVAARERAHYKASDHLRVLHYTVGFTLIVVSAIVSSTVIKGVDGNPSSTATLIAGILALVVTILTAVQTTFKVGERAEQHRTAAAAFGKIKSRLDVFAHEPHSDIPAAWKNLLQIADDMANIDAGAPGYLGRTYEQASSEAKKGLMEQPGAPKTSAAAEA